MRRFLSRKSSPAMVVACVALVVALGGTSYAAFRIPANSVGTKQLRNGAVTSGAHTITLQGAFLDGTSAPSAYDRTISAVDEG